MNKILIINKKQDNSKIKAYYQDELNYGLAEEIIKYFWLSKKPQHNNDNLELINDDSYHSFKPQLIKRKKKCETYILEYNDETFFIKRYFSVSLDKKLLNITRRAKAHKCLLYSDRLSTAGFNVAEPVFALIYKNGSLGKESVFVMKKYPGINFREYLNSYDPNIKKEEAILSFAATIGNFYKNGFIHGDPNLENFIINEVNGQYTFGFIDIDEIYRRAPSKKAVLKSIGKLCSFVYCSLNDSNQSILNSEEKMMFYLSEILKSYNPRITIDYARRIVIKQAVRVFIHWNNGSIIENYNLFKKYI